MMGAAPMKRAMGTSNPQGIRSMKLGFGGEGSVSFMIASRVDVEVEKKNGSPFLTQAGGRRNLFLADSVGQCYDDG